MNSRVLQPLNKPKGSDARNERGYGNKKSDQDDSKAQFPNGKNHDGTNKVNYFTPVANVDSGRFCGQN